MQTQLSLASIHSNASDAPSHISMNKRAYLLAKPIEIEQNEGNKSHNIFEDPDALKVCQSDPNLGPRIENNKIIKRSVVGNPDIFKKKHLQNPNYSTTVHKSERSRYSSFKTNQDTQRALGQPTVKVANQEEIQRKVNNLEKMLFHNRLQELEQLRMMPFEIRQNLHRDTRALEQFEKSEHDSNRLLFDLARNLSRDPSKSVMMDQQQYRKKVEYSVTNELLRMKSEERDTRILEMNEEDSAVPLLFVLQSPKQEIIRRPRPSLPQHDETVQSLLKSLNDDQAYNSFTTNDYLRHQYEKHKQHSSGILQISPEELIVIGQSKLNSELNYDPNHKYQIGNIDGEGKVNEIIEEKYIGQYKLKYK